MIKELRNHVLINPTKEEDWIPEISNCLRSKVSLKLDEKILLGAIHWYFDENVRFLFNLWLDENWGGEFKEVKSVILSSKTNALGYLLVSDRFNEFDFFGNLLTSRVLKRLSHFSLRGPKRSNQIRKSGIKYPNFCDYKDKGSKRPDHNPEPLYNFRKLRSVEEQMLIEAELGLKTDQLFFLVEERLKKEIS